MRRRQPDLVDASEESSGPTPQQRQSELFRGPTKRMNSLSCKILCLLFLVVGLNLSQPWWWSSLFSSSPSEPSIIPADRRPREPFYAKHGEAPEELLNDKGVTILPIHGDWSHDAWKDTYPRLHGNNIKIICTLFHRNASAPSELAVSPSQQPIRSNVDVVRKHDDQQSVEGDSALPYRVLLRPLQAGGSIEYLAYVLAQELGVHKIPTQTVLPDLFPIDTPWKNYTDYVNIQSLLYGVQMTFIDKWTNCLPNMKESSSTSQKIMNTTTTITNNRSSFSELDLLYIGNETLPKTKSTTKGPISPQTPQDGRFIRLRPVEANASQTWKICLRNMDKYDGNWRKTCLTNTPTIRRCRHDEMAQLVEMALFDALILNGERLRFKGGPINNIHWLWPPHVEPSVNDTTSTKPLELVWLDHGHYSFGTGRGEMMEFFQTYCIFSGHLLRRIFKNHRPWSVVMKERMGSQLM
jgi:hypothetical protein